MKRSKNEKISKSSNETIQKFKDWYTGNFKVEVSTEDVITITVVAYMLSVQKMIDTGEIEI